jgi:hypothetical protein
LSHGSLPGLNVASETAKFRKYPRLRAPKGLWVAWKSSAQTTTSRAEVMGMGGLFLQAAQAPSDGSYIELIFDLPTGQVRGRAIVRDSTPGKGMGIQFVQMKTEDRAKLNRFFVRAGSFATSRRRRSGCKQGTRRRPSRSDSRRGFALGDNASG